MLTPPSGAEQVNPDAHLVLTFKETPVLNDSGMIRVYDAQTHLLVDSLDLSIPAGPTQGRTYGPECDYTKIPYDYTRTAMATNRDTRPGTPSGTAEPTPPDYQLTIIGGFTDAFHFYPVIVRDSIATIYLHHHMLEYGHSYYVTIDKGVLSLPDNSFHGIQKGQWTFSTKASGPAHIDTLTVDATGKGDFNTVQGALDYIPDFNQQPTLILVAPGDYEELVYTRNKSNLTIRGAGMNQTRVHYANNEVFNPHPLTVKTNEWPGTFPSRRAAFMLDNCHDVTLEELTIATDLFGQAEGLLINGERIALHRVHIIGSGDALQANGTIYMQECELDGGGDTILGRGSLFAYRSNFRNGGGPFSWVRNRDGNHGDIFVECTFSTFNGRDADYGRTGSKNAKNKYPEAEFVLIDCKTRNIVPAGWGSIASKSSRLYEYNTCELETGRPVDVSKRHPYSRQLHKVKDAELIRNYRNPAYVLKGWTPAGFQ
ncbi:MAG: carbohydrate esterase [Prevotellaceae bacterium]|nr:carbohydrate esterase [Prevotellaceae bacterium]